MIIDLLKILLLFIALTLATPIHALNISRYVNQLVTLGQSFDSEKESEERMLAILLIDKRAGFEIDSKSGNNTALYFALVNKFPPLVRALLRAGASPNIICIHNSRILPMVEFARSVGINLEIPPEIPSLSEEKLALKRKHQGTDENKHKSAKKIKISKQEEKIQAWHPVPTLESELSVYFDEWNL